MPKYVPNEDRVPPPLDALRALRGIGATVFKELGGGEEFLRKERKALVFPSDRGRVNEHSNNQ